MARWTQRRQAFRAVMEGDTCVYPGSVFDPMSARVAQDIGYEIGMLGGSTASLAVLGAPDLIVLTLTELAEQCRRICRASEIPLMVDADHGYGNALSVARTVEELESAGICGISIEDTDLPQPFGTDGKARLLSVAEGVGKMKAAVKTRSDTGLFIAARTSAPVLTGMADTIERVKAYQDVDVDAIFLVGVKTRAQLDEISAVVTKPIILGTATAELFDLKYLAKRGVRICLQGHQPIRAAVKAIHDTMRALRDGATPAEITGLASTELMDVATAENAYNKALKDYL